MLKEITIEAYNGKDIKKEGLSPAQEIMEDLSKYAMKQRLGKVIFMTHKYFLYM